MEVSSGVRKMALETAAVGNGMPSKCPLAPYKVPKIRGGGMLLFWTLWLQEKYLGGSNTPRHHLVDRAPHGASLLLAHSSASR